jgi:uncharacterized protein (DUF2141 family)
MTANEARRPIAHPPQGIPRHHGSRLLAAFALLLASTASSATLTVTITGVEAPLGSLGCSLFADARGFPMDNGAARVQWLPSQTGRMTCRFDNVASGRYAVAIGHDANGNRRVDTNLFGMPTEQWGVSGNVRPSLRAPRFDQAAFAMPADGSDLAIEITVKP